MPSRLHETLVEMFRERPTLAAELLTDTFGFEVPDFQQARISSGELTDVLPTEYRADVVITLTIGDDPVLAVVVEAQLRADARKRRTWPVCVATMYARLGCPVALLVVCPSSTVARWCAAPIMVGPPSLVLSPYVLGPDRVPVITDPLVARSSPELAVLSALAHGGEPGQESVLEALVAALSTVDTDHATLYADVVLAVLPARPGTTWRTSCA